MDLKEKLALMESLSNMPVRRQPAVEKPVLEESLDGESIETPHGPCFVITRRFESGTRHGNESIGGTGNISSDSLALIGKGEDYAEIDLSRTLFFDTETTGLSSGTGTHIFLAGFGYFDKEDFIVKQFLLRELDEETAFLHAINALLKDYSYIVSYNGRSFDWPVLATRFVYSRIRSNLPHPLHLDLLYTARRIWKRRLGDCSLQNIEREILDFHRVDDIPGFEIPGKYFQYLRDKQADALLPIITHNQLDIVTLAVLLSKSASIVSDPKVHLAADDDLFSLAVAFESMGRWDHSIGIYEHMLERRAKGKMRQDAALRLSYCYKRTRQWLPAIELWENIISQGHIDIEPYVELAKYEEHHRRDYESAANIVSRALKLLDIADELHGETGPACQRDALDHRLRRIRKKMERS